MSGRPFVIILARVQPSNVGISRSPRGSSPQHPVHALLEGGVVDESPIYVLLANSRLNPIDFLVLKSSIS